jgi:hypothetical protein
MADIEYTFNGNGATVGKSGTRYSYRAGRPVTAPAGEFDHLGEGVYQTRPMRAAGVRAPLPPGADPEVDVVVSATPGTPPDPAADPDGPSANDPKADNAKSAPDRRISKNGSWFTLTEDGEEVGKVQGEEAAKAWQAGGDLPK